MKIALIIPIVNKKLGIALLSSIAQNTMLPSQIIIIDNTPERPLVIKSSFKSSNVSCSERKLLLYKQTELL